jgi:hypothetical protein
MYINQMQLPFPEQILSEYKAVILFTAADKSARNSDIKVEVVFHYSTEEAPKQSLAVFYYRFAVHCPMGRFIDKSRIQIKCLRTNISN